MKSMKNKYWLQWPTFLQLQRRFIELYTNKILKFCNVLYQKKNKFRILTALVKKKYGLSIKVTKRQGAKTIMGHSDLLFFYCTEDSSNYIQTNF